MTGSEHPGKVADPERVQHVPIEPMFHHVDTDQRNVERGDEYVHECEKNEIDEVGLSILLFDYERIEEEDVLDEADYRDQRTRDRDHVEPGGVGRNAETVDLEARRRVVVVVRHLDRLLSVVGARCLSGKFCGFFCVIVFGCISHRLGF